jgi:hypothetical protein
MLAAPVSQNPAIQFVIETASNESPERRDDHYVLASGGYYFDGSGGSPVESPENHSSSRLFTQPGS